MPRRGLPGTKRAFEVQRAADVRGNLRHADRAHGRQCWIEAAGEKRTNLRDAFVAQHAFEPSITARVEPVARRQKDERHEANLAPDPTLFLLLPIAERPSGRSHDFQRPRHACRVGRAQPRGCLGILAGKRRVGLGNFERAHLRPYGRIDWRDRSDPLQQRSDIKACPADENRQPFLLMRLPYRSSRIGGPIGSRAGVRAVATTVKKVRSARFLIGRGAG